MKEVHISASQKGLYSKLYELWEYRELIYFLAWKEIKVRYKQTIIGVSWAIIQPLLTMIIFTLFFGRLAKVPSDGLPYPIFAFSALVPWTFFANSVSLASNSLIVNANMIKKIFFPRLAIPISIVIAGVLDFILAFILLVILVLAYGIVPKLQVLLLPFLFLLAFFSALGAGFWLSAMNARFRDVRYVVPFLIQAWLFITPIAYPSSLLDQPWKTVYGLNPMAGVVEGFRWALLGTGSPPGTLMLVGFVVSVLLLISGVMYFQRVDRTLADVI